MREFIKSMHKKSGDVRPVVVSSWLMFDIMAFISDMVMQKS